MADGFEEEESCLPCLMSVVRFLDWLAPDEIIGTDVDSLAERGPEGPGVTAT